MVSSGTHWISNLIHLMVQKRPIDEAVPYRMRLLDLGAPDLIESAPSPRVLASHRRPHQLPEDVSRLKKKVVLICRNPKDTAVSHFFHLCNTGYKLTWARFLEYWMEGLSKFATLMLSLRTMYYRDNSFDLHVHVHNKYVVTMVRRWHVLLLVCWPIFYLDKTC